MTPKQMLKTPVAKRRGAVTQETGSWGYLLVDAPPDTMLDRLLADGVIGAARRDCLTDLRAGKVPRPVGPWGVLVRLKGHRWTYLIGDGLRFEWPQAFAKTHGWRVAWFSLDGMINTKVARLFDGPREVFNFSAGLLNPEPGFLVRENVGDDTAMIRGEDNAVCSEAWLAKLKSGGQAMDLLARAADAYLPVALFKRDTEGKAGVGGWDGEPYDADEDEAQEIPDDAFERVDVLTFGKADTLEPTPAAIALGKAVRAGDAKAAKQAIAAGADPNVMYDDDESPLHVALNLGSPYLGGGRFAKVKLKQQLELVKVLLDGGATPDPEGEDTAIHQAIHWADGGDERDLVAQLRVLLDGKADPNAEGTFLRGAGQRPLHVLTRFGQRLPSIKLLVSRGADVSLTNHKGETPRQLAEKRLGELEATIAKHAPQAGDAPASLGGMAALFAKGLTGGDGAMAGVMGAMSANLMRASVDSSKTELERTRALVAFFADAERGKAEVSDVDALADAASAEHAKEQAAHDREREASLASLLGAKSKLLDQLSKLQESDGE